MTTFVPGGPNLVAFGLLDRTTIDDVVAMAGVSRQGLCLVLKYRGVEVGRALLKAGAVFMVNAEPGLHGLDALISLRSRDLTSFEIYQVPMPDGQPVGDLASMWSRLPKASFTNSRLFRGRFDRVSLSDLLATLSVSRQRLGVVFWRQGVPIGSWVTKAGQILEADAGFGMQLTPQEAFNQILKDPGDSFTVVEMRGPESGQTLGNFFEWGADSAPSGEVRELLGTAPAHSQSFGELLTWLSRPDEARRLMIRRSGRVVGELVIQAGRLVAARNAHGRTGREAFLQLAFSYERPGTTCEVYRTTVRDSSADVGNLVDLLGDLQTESAPSPPPPAAAKAPQRGARRLFSGSFQRIPLDDLLAVLSVARRRVGVVMYQGSKPLGGWVFKAGQLLDAVVLGQTAPAAQAFAHLRENHGDRFVVVEYEHALGGETPQGGLDELVRGVPVQAPAPKPMASAAASSGPSRQPGAAHDVVMEGSLEDAPLFLVLISLGLSRQQLVIEVWVGGLMTGSIIMRSSQVLSAEHVSGASGQEAVFRLLTTAGADRYRVVHSHQDPDTFTPLGSLPDVLGQLRESLKGSGPRLVIPGETELMAWLESPPASSPQSRRPTPAPLPPAAPVAQAEVASESPSGVAELAVLKEMVRAQSQQIQILLGVHLVTLFTLVLVGFGLGFLVMMD